MYENSGTPKFDVKAGINPGFKISSYEITDNNWKLTFEKGEFKSIFFGNFPYLAEGKEEKWPNINFYWGKDIVAIFKQFMPVSIVDQTVSELVAKIREVVTEDEEKTQEGIMTGAKILIEGLLEAANPFFQETEFNLLLAYRMGIDSEGNEKYYLNIPGLSTKGGNKWQDENGWQGGYPFAVGINPPMNPNLDYVKPGVDSTEAEPTIVQTTETVANTESTEFTDIAEW